MSHRDQHGWVDVDALRRSHAELLEALKQARKLYRATRAQVFGTDVHEEMLTIAINKAEGGTP